jgi:MFS family permease
MTSTLAVAGARLWAPARQTPFRLLWAGQALSLLGDGFSVIAFAWITLSVTNSTLALGYVLAVQAVPRALLTLVGGSLADRWSPRTVMMLSSWARAGVMLAVAVAGVTGALTLTVLCVTAAAFGAVDAFFQPARASILPSVVEPEMLAPANALLGAGARVAAVVGPALGGVVVATAGAEAAFFVVAVCFALCAVCVAGIRASRPPVPASPAADGPAPSDAADSLWARMRAGVRYAVRDPRIRTILVVDMVVTFCYAGPFTVGFAALATTDLRGGSATLGILNGALAAGAIGGTLIGGTMNGRPRVGLLVAALAGWLAVGMALLGGLDSAIAAAGTVFAMGFGIGFQGVFGMSWIQRNIDGAVLSRVIAFDMVLGYAVAPLSLILCGALAGAGSSTVFAVVAVVLAITALGTLTSRPVREMR